MNIYLIILCLVAEKLKKIDIFDLLCCYETWVCYVYCLSVDAIFSCFN